MKTQIKSASHVARRSTARKDNSALATCSLPRLFLFLELFVDREIPQRSLK
jgi:hypothetical protein